MDKKVILWLAIIGFVVFTAAVPFWTFTNLEENLNQEALELSSVKVLENAELEWNGRNGYLTVPADLSEDIAESAVEEIEGIQGVRNVVIIYDESRTSSLEDENAEDVQEEAQIVTESGKFTINWTEDSKSISGSLNEDGADKVQVLFNVEGLDVDEKYTLSDDVFAKLGALGADIFVNLKEGALSVDGDAIKLSGTAYNPKTYNALMAKLSSTEGIELNIPKIDEAEYVQGEIDKLLETDKIEFAYKKYEVTPETELILDKVVELLKEYEGVHVDINGHTDSVGSERYNLNLSKDRAETVRNLLIEKGIAADRLTATGIGEGEPIDTNETKEGRQANRRVEIIVKGND